MENTSNVHKALEHTQNDTKMLLNWANTMDQSCPITASVNEVLKHAIRRGYGRHDSSAIYMNSEL